MTKLQNNNGEIPELEAHRKLVYMLAESQLTSSLRSKVDAEDIVQETMVAAYNSFLQVREPSNPAAVKKWLKKILCNILADQFRRYGTEKRDLNLEHSIAVSVDHSSEGVDGWVVAGHTSPSMAAARSEELVKLADGLRKLPVDVREVVVQKHINNRSIKEIAALTGRSTAAVAGQLRRGLAKLRESFE